MTKSSRFILSRILPAIVALCVGIAPAAEFGETDYLLQDAIWISDGTAAGTRLVKLTNAVTPGTIQMLSSTLKSNGLLFFIFDDLKGGAALWSTDGTAENTKLLKAGNVSQKYVNWGLRRFWPILAGIGGNSVYFSLQDDALWKTDGRLPGTKFVRLLDLESGIREFENRLYLSQGLDQPRPCVSDLDLTSITVLTGTNPADAPRSSRILGIVNGEICLSAYDNQHGDELWMTDGTSDGTRLLRDIQPGAAHSGPSGTGPPVYLGNSVLFDASMENTSALWKTDGTPNGTVLIKGSPFSFEITGAHVWKEKAFLAGWFNVAGAELWSTDGTEGGTVLIKDINPGSAHGLKSESVEFGELPDCLLFAADNGVLGRELWRTDGTAEGTLLVKDINPGALGSEPYSFLSLNGLVYFFVKNTGGYELWRSDGTEAGTTLVKQLVGEPLGRLAEINGKIFFRTESTFVRDDDYSEPVVAPLISSKVSLKLNFTRANSDSLAITGSIPAASPDTIRAQQVVVKLGAIERTISFAAAQSKSGISGGGFAIRAAKSRLTGEGFAFTFELKNADLRSALAADGFVNEDVKSNSLVLPFSLKFTGNGLPDQSLSQPLPLTYSAKKGKAGSAKLAK